MRTTSKYTLLACLYLAQGLPYGFFKQALPVVMREQGASLPQIGLLSFLALPWALKFLWAPFVDRLGNLRRWILLLQCLSALLFLALGHWIVQSDYVWLAWAFALANGLAATQDIASDGLAVVLLKPHERGIGNGIQVAGYRVGMVIGGGLILMAFGVLGWSGMFYGIAVLILCSTLPVLLLRVPQPAGPRLEYGGWNVLKTRMMRPGLLPWLGVIGLYKFGDAIGSNMLQPFLSDMGLALVDIGRLLGTVGFVAGLLGALVGGVLVERLGRFRALLWLGILQALAVGLYVTVNADQQLWLAVVCALEHFTGGMATAALFTAMMDMCMSRFAATDYSLQASCVVIATSFAGVFGGWVAGNFGYTLNFLLAALLSLVGALVFATRYVELTRLLTDPNSGAVQA